MRGGEKCLITIYWRHPKSYMAIIVPNRIENKAT